MRRLLPVIVILATACSLLPGRAPTPTPRAAMATPTAAVSATAGASSTAAATAVALPSAVLSGIATTAPTAVTPAPAASPTAPSPYRLAAADVRFEPDPQLYSGDVASIIAIGRGGAAEWQGARAKVFINSLSAPPLAQADFAPYGLGNQWQATFTWAWDTRGQVGPQVVYVEVDPPVQKGLPVLTQTVAVPVTIWPASSRPAPEAETHWAIAESVCCTFHYLTNTAAARDIDLIRVTADTALAHDEAVLGVKQQGKITFTLLSRLLGNGGFTASEVSITYVDRNAAASELYTIFAHEGTHVLDRQIARTRPTIMTEGLAVYVAGGHFKTEPIEARSAAVLALNDYIPLTDLANHFYDSQHEVGYLEAAGFIQYLVEQFGWPRFRAMYGSFNSAPSDGQMLDAGLKAQYGQGLGQLEAAWLAHLKSAPPDPTQVDNLRLTIDLYDTMRRYQLRYDPSAYFLTAWLPDETEARKRSLFADYLRHPDTPDDIALETMLVAAGQELNDGAYDQASALLTAVNAALDAGSLSASPLSAEQLAVVDQVLAAGYEPQRITLSQNSATVQAIGRWPQLDQLTLQRGAGGWQVLASGWLASALHFGQ